MLTTQQQFLLKAAAKSPQKTRGDEINKVTKTLKLTTPSSFHTYDADGTPSESMKQRRFFDEPYSLKPSDFLSYEVQFLRGKQKEIFEIRDKNLLKK
jgi:hypothetical protein